MARRALAVLVVSACGGVPHDMAADASGDAPRDALADATLEGSIDAPPDAAVPLDPFVELQHMPGLCTPDEWCWALPTPAGNDYLHVRITGPDNIWLLGKGRTVLQWDGHTWRAHHPLFAPGQEALQEPWPYGIDGRAPNDMWLIFGSTIQHWNGATWSIADTGSFTGIPYNTIWASPNADVYTVGQAGLLHSMNGGPFVPMTGVPAGNMVGLWGTGPDDVFLAQQGQTQHFDGQAWTQVYAGAGTTTSFQGTKNDAWASGGANTLLHWYGSAFTPVATGLAATAGPRAIAWNSTNDAWWYGGQSFLHWDGTQITATAIDTGIHTGLGADVAMVGDAVWFVGLFGSIDRRVGPATIGTVVDPPYLGYSLWGTSDTDMYFAGGGLRHWDGATLAEVIPTGVDAVRGIAGTPELFAIGGEIDFGTTPHDHVGFGYHFDGLAWTKTELLRNRDAAETLGALHAIAPGEAMIVGRGGTVFYRHAGTWTRVTTGVTADLAGVWGPDADHVWISGKAGTLLRWDRASPTVVTPDPTFPATTDDLGEITGAGGEMWILRNPGATTLVSRRAASGAWSIVDTNLITQSIFAVSADNVVATTNTSYFVSRWNGVEFVVEKHGSAWPARYVFQPAGGHMWLSNGQGVQLHH